MEEQEKYYQLNLLDFWFNNITLNFDKATPLQDEKNTPFEQSFKKTIKKIDENNAIVELTFSLINPSIKSFLVEISVCGKFKCLDWETSEVSKSLIEDNATAILFPYLRHAVSDVTTLAGLPPFIIPVMNVAQIFKKQKNQK